MLNAWYDLVINAAIIALIVFIVLFLYKIIMYTIKKGAKKQQIPIEARNGMKIFIRLIVVLLIVIAILTYIPGFAVYLFSISSITGIIIGFATTQVVNQLIAGIYLLFSRPFKINDLVNINGIDGIIFEIGLNFTTLQKFSGSLVKIPNKTILDAEIRKYTIKLTPEVVQNIEERGILKHLSQSSKFTPENKDRKDRKLKLGALKDVIIEREIIRYTFEIAVDLDQPPKDVIKSIEDVCKAHEKVYKYTPQFIVTYLYWRVHIRFKIYCNNPFIIVRNHSLFIHDVISSIYGGV